MNRQPENQPCPFPRYCPHARCRRAGGCRARSGARCAGRAAMNASLRSRLLGLTAALAERMGR